MLTQRFRFIRALLTRRLWRVEVTGRSMAPSLLPGQVVWCETKPPVGELRVGDVVVLENTESDARTTTSRQADADLSIKRLSGLPTQPAFGRPAPPRGFCEVLGDNAAHSADSRHFGPIPIRSVVARAIFMPPARARDQPDAVAPPQRAGRSPQPR